MKLLLAVLALWFCQATSETRIRSGGLHKYFMSGEHFHYYSFFFFVGPSRSENKGDIQIFNIRILRQDSAISSNLCVVYRFST